MNIKVKSLIKAILRPFAYFVVLCLDGYGWRGFLCRIFIVTILFTVNPLDKAARSGPVSGMKLWFFTLVVLIFAICKMIFDCTKAGKEAEEKKRKSENAD